MDNVLTVFGLIEANKFTGPVKNLLDFCARSRQMKDDSPDFAIHCSLATFRRDGDLACSHAEFVNACEAARVELEFISERFRFDTRVLKQLCNLVERRAPDIIQTHNVKSHFLVRWSGLWHKYPWIAFHHGYTATDLKMCVYNRLDRWSLLAADRVVTVSHSAAQELERIGVDPSRLRVVHNAISPNPESDAGAGVALRRSLGISDEQWVVLAAGRLSREKGHADLVTAFAYLAQQQPARSICLVVAGDGPERHRIETLTKSLDGNHRVLLPGHVSNLRAYYAMADLMVLPSHSEGSPNVLLEAMAAGLPIVATRVGGVPEIVRHGQSAILVEPRKPRALANGISLLLADHSLARQLGANALRAVLDYSPLARAQALIQIYDELVPSRALVGSSIAQSDSKVMG
jgi:glycosyltransferase involved in cell wall biosynthesis